MHDPTRDLNDLLRLENRVAVVVGGAGHIGTAIADGLAELGAIVAVADRDHESHEGGVPGRGPDLASNICKYMIDLESDGAEVLLRDTVLKDHGRVDILVHAAAMVGDSNLSGWTGPFEDQSLDSWRRAMDVNLSSVFSVAQAFAPALRDSRRGAIVTIGSIYGVVGVDLRLYDSTEMGSPAAYSASKGGVIQLTRWLATVLAPEIRVNTVSPGGVLRGQPETFIRRYEDRVPLRRMATEVDIKGAVAFLASDAAAYITGQNLMVDGGWTAW